MTSSINTDDLTLLAPILKFEETKLAKNPTMVVQAWMHLRKATFRYRSESCCFDGDIMHNSLILDAIMVSCQRSGLHMTEAKLKHPLRMWKESQRGAYVDDLRSELCRPHDEERQHRGHQEMVKFITLLTGHCGPLDVAVMEHFIWQVKRKLMRKDVLWHLMPILYGTQGTGKTTILADCFLSPLKEVWQKEDFRIFKDSRKWYGFKKYYVLFFDEMRDTKNTDVENIKSFMSQGEVSHRPLHSNDMESLPNNSTFIGASNKKLHDLVKDDEMRRFWQIDVLDKEDIRKNWAALQNLDYDLIWDCAHEDLESPIVPFLPELEGAQKAYSTTGSVARFVSERLDANGLKAHTADACWGLFTRWSQDHGEAEPPLKKNAFLRELKNLVKKDQKTGNMAYYFTVKDHG